MSENTNKISIVVSSDEYNQLKALAQLQNMDLNNFIRSFLLVFIDDKDILGSISGIEAKIKLEDELQKIAQKLEKKQRFTDLLLRSIYSTQLRLEGQFKKYRLEASKELEKDFERISMLVDSAKTK